MGDAQDLAEMYDEEALGGTESAPSHSELLSPDLGGDDDVAELIATYDEAEGPLGPEEAAMHIENGPSEGTITVGVDESDSAAEALRWALEEGDRRGWPVRAVLAWTLLRQHHSDRTDTFVSGYSATDATLALQTYVNDAVGADSAGLVELLVPCERAAVALVDAASDSSLLVVGSRGLGGLRGLAVGSVSQECLHHSTVPVAVIRGSDKRSGHGGEPVDVSPGKIVVGIDGSDTSRRALRWALDEARSRAGWVEVVHGWLLPAAYGYPTLALPDLAIYEESAEAMVSKIVDEVDTSGLSQPLSRIVAGGTSTAGLLCERSADAEMLVVGSRGVGGFRGMLVGSVAQHLAHHAPCPLVVIPATD